MKNSLFYVSLAITIMSTCSFALTFSDLSGRWIKTKNITVLGDKSTEMIDSISKNGTVFNFFRSDSVILHEYTDESPQCIYVYDYSYQFVGDTITMLLHSSSGELVDEIIASIKIVGNELSFKYENLPKITGMTSEKYIILKRYTGILPLEWPVSICPE